MKAFHCTKRRGWTLLEMMVVMPLMAILLTGAAVLLTTLLRSQKGLWDDLQMDASRSRMAVQLRGDAHEAQSAESPTPEMCDFVLVSGQVVHYEIKADRLHRELRSGEKVLARDSFPLDRAQGVFSIDESKQLPLVRLTLTADEVPRRFEPPSRSSLLEAAVGVHHATRGGRTP